MMRKRGDLDIDPNLFGDQDDEEDTSLTSQESRTTQNSFLKPFRAIAAGFGIKQDDIELVKYEDNQSENPGSDDELEETIGDINTDKRVLNVDDLLKESGGFGCWHLFTFIL